jgi:5-methylcytosine-specific restriction endonuclease McrA
MKAAEYGNRRRARKLGAGGDFTAGQILILYNRQRGRCACCKNKLKVGYHKDHRKALVNGGDNSIRNIELLCPGCNLAKGAKDEIHWANLNGRLI